MRSGVRAILIVGAALLLAPGLTSLAGTVLPVEPPAPTLPTDPWWLDWSRDRDGNRIDDALERLHRDGAAYGYTPSGLPRYAFHESPAGLRYDVFVRFAPGTPLDVDAVAALTHTHAHAFPLAEAVHVQGVAHGQLAGLLALPGVVGIELERTVRPSMDVASPATLTTFSNQSGNGARGRFRLAGHGTVIAVLDSGIDNEHEAFEAIRFLGGYDATFPPLRSLGISTPLNEVDPDDEDGHGTHVAGIAFGVDPNNTYTGMAPAAKFLDVRVMRTLPLELGTMGTSGIAFGVGSMVMSGLEFVAAYNRGETYLGPPGNDKVDIVVLSLSENEADPDGSSVLATAVNNLVLTGVHAVTAAGNCGPGGNPSDCCNVDPVSDLLGQPCNGQRGNNTIAAPGSARLGITVAAADDHGTIDWRDDTMANASSRGPNGGEKKPNLAAFGVNITAPAGHPNATATNGYTNRSGTSMAAPMVAGALALLLEADPELSPEAAKRLLMQTARDMGEPGWDPIAGAGILNTYYAAGVALGFIDPDEPIGDDGKDAGAHPPPTNNTTTPNVTFANRGPQVAFDFAPSPARIGVDIVFVDKSRDPERDALVSWAWDFGDGHTGHGDRSSHAYDRPGSYTVRLTVTDIKGTAGSARATVVVHGDGTEARESPTPPILPTLAFLATLFILRRARDGRL